MGKGGKYSRYVSYQAFCTQVEVIGIRHEYCSSIHNMIQAWAPGDCPHVYVQVCRAAMPLKQPPTYTCGQFPGAHGHKGHGEWNHSDNAACNE